MFARLFQFACALAKISNYEPRPSGLCRPLTILEIVDQIFDAFHPGFSDVCGDDRPSEEKLVELIRDIVFNGVRTGEPAKEGKNKVPTFKDLKKAAEGFKSDDPAAGCVKQIVIAFANRAEDSVKNYVKVLRNARFRSIEQFEIVVMFFEFLRAAQIAVPSLMKFRFMGGPRRDVVLLLPGSEVKIFMRWGDFLGKHVMHCHNVVHEDHAMMLRWDIVPPGDGFDGSKHRDEVYGKIKRTKHVSPFPATIHAHPDDRDGQNQR